MILFQKIHALFHILRAGVFGKAPARQEELNMNNDGSWKVFFANPSRYADAINGFGCKGQQVVSADDLQDVDTEAWGIRVPKFVHHLSRDKAWHKSKHRDMVQKTAFGVNFAIIGLENQDTIDYSLPLRNMEYDVAEYEKQAAKIRRKVRENPKGLKAGEYLYGFLQDSKLSPVLTFILYSGIEKWNGPTCLHDMLDFTDIPESIRELIPNYKIVVIPIRELEDTSIFKTDLRYVLEFMKCAEDKHKLKNLIENNAYFESMEEDAYDVVANYADITERVAMKEYSMEGGKVNMCKGLRDWLADEVAEGKAEGKAEGIVKTARKYHAKDEEIIEQLMEELGVDEETAKQYL